MISWRNFYKTLFFSSSDSDNGETLIEKIMEDNNGISDNVVIEKKVMLKKKPLYQLPNSEYSTMPSFSIDNVDENNICKTSGEEKKEAGIQGKNDIFCENRQSEITLANECGTTYNVSDTSIASDNCSYNKCNGELFERLSGFMDELEMIANKTNDKNVLSIINYCTNRIFEILLSEGCEIIDGDEYFNSICHITSPFAIVPEGSVIMETLSPGLKYCDKVLKKAIVKVQS